MEKKKKVGKMVTLNRAVTKEREEERRKGWKEVLTKERKEEENEVTHTTVTIIIKRESKSILQSYESNLWPLIRNLI